MRFLFPVLIALVFSACSGLPVQEPPAFDHVAGGIHVDEDLNKSFNAEFAGTWGEYATRITVFYDEGQNHLIKLCLWFNDGSMDLVYCPEFILGDEEGGDPQIEGSGEPGPGEGLPDEGMEPDMPPEEVAPEFDVEE